MSPLLISHKNLPKLKSKEQSSRGIIITIFAVDEMDED
jgi:hypothetical protein